MGKIPVGSLRTGANHSNGYQIIGMLSGTAGNRRDNQRPGHGNA
jgi:hypothetical protein